MGFWDKVFGRVDAVAPEPEQHRSVFSTHENDDPIQSGGQKRGIAAWGALLARLESNAPVVPEIAGAMDGSDDSADTGTLKNAYALSQPNLSELLLMWYVSQSFIGAQMCAILAQHWLIYKACSMPGRDAIRQGYDIVTTGGKDLPPEILEMVKHYDEQFKLNRHMERFVTFGRVFGIRIALFKVETDDKEYYEKPFNIDGITPNSYKGIVQVDPYWCAPVLDAESSAQPDSLHFYEPTWWIINGKRYHRSHLVIFVNSEVPDVLKPSYQYGGVPVPQKIMERVYAAERTANEGPMLAMTKRTTVFQTNIGKAFANKQQFDERMAEWVARRDNQQIKIADVNDLVSQFDTSLTDLDSVIMTQYQIVAAASNVPATKLLGTTPKGFNSTGEYEESSYHEELESIQTHDLTPLMLRHHQLIVRSYILPKFGVSPDVRGNWKPLDSPTAAELADINLKKSQTGQQLVTAGAIDGVDERDRLIADKESGYTGMAAALRQTEPDEDDNAQENTPDPAQKV